MGKLAPGLERWKSNYREGESEEENEARMDRDTKETNSNDI